MGYVIIEAGKYKIVRVNWLGGNSGKIWCCGRLYLKFTHRLELQQGN
jgi:hypothetical protein